ncbi:MAG: chloride channel protein [Acidobacteria bacterium]|nr:MAG: chloride channel protein [Acidobacteriota bacterium]
MPFENRDQGAAGQIESSETVWDRVSRFFAHIDLYNFGRWMLLAIAVGVVAGLGAAFLTWGVDWVASVFLGRVAGFEPPGHGIHAVADGWSHPQRPWFLLIVLPGVGLVVGWLVQTFAPEAEGHGTDAVIKAFHQNRAELRPRVVPVKLLASMLTIGSGGSAGREGPVAQIGAGFGSYLADVLKLRVRDRRTLVITGMAAGIGGMFRAPLGGALFAIEALYSENDYESEALIPALMASIVSYVVVASLTGWSSVFTAHVDPFARPQELISYFVLGVVLSVIGVIWVKVFYGMRDGFFARLNVPAPVKPAIGGLLIACLALNLPQVLGGGYGWLQMAMGPGLPLAILLALIPAKILATSFTISSGGSGGVFAPSLVIGGLTGAVFAELLARFAPFMAPSATACILVGMGGFFAGVAKAPIASLIMVAEMSGSYSLLVPMMLVSSITFVLTRGVNIYEAQVPGRVDSPAHLGDFQIDILERLSVKGLIDEHQDVVTLSPGMPFRQVMDVVFTGTQAHYPVVDAEGAVHGLLSVNDVRRVMATPEVWDLLVAGDIEVDTPSVGFVTPEEDLHTVIRRFTALRLEVLPVFSDTPPAPIIGLLRYQDVMEAYDNEIHRLRGDE